MATNEVGGRPSASGQNDYNASRYQTKFDVNVRLPGRNILEAPVNQSGSGTIWSRATQTVEHPGIGTMQMIFPAAKGQDAGKNYSTNYTVSGQGKSLTNTDSSYSTTFEVVSSSSRTSGGDEKFTEFIVEVNAPVGQYSVSYSWTDLPPVTFRGAVDLDFEVAVKGQTDIPEDAPIKVWKSDFSDYLPPQAYDDGLPIDLSTSGRAGWEDVT